jgi:hypothetical protein
MNPKITIILVVILSTFAIFLSFSSDWNDTITGRQTITSRVNVITVNSSECSFTLYQGLNLVSFYCLGTLNPTVYTLISINDSYESIFKYDAFDTNDNWKSYNPSLPSWAVQQLNYLDRLSGYYIFMKNDSTYYYNGSKKYSQISLVPGWNLVGYPRLINESPNISLSNISYTHIIGYDKSTPQYIIYQFNQTNNTLNQTSTYQGYWLNSTAYQTWMLQAE